MSLLYKNNCILALTLVIGLSFLPLHNAYADDFVKSIIDFFFKEKEPSRDDLINAVRKSVSGKKYKKYVSRLTFNPVSGEVEPITVDEIHSCIDLPKSNSNWSVIKIDSQKWRVSHHDSMWDFTSITNKSANVNLIFIEIEGNLRAFVIEPHQDC